MPDNREKEQALLRRLSNAMIDPQTWADAGRGASQGLTMGFGDELVGFALADQERLAAEAAGEEMTREKFFENYRNYRDAERAAVKASRERSPVATIGGSVVAGLATPMPIFGGVRGAAAAGALSGLGDSAADLTQGDVGGAVLDTAKGAAMSAMLAKGAEKLMKVVRHKQPDGSYKTIPSDAPDEVKFPFLEQEVITESDVPQPRWLFHGTAAPREALEQGMEPQHGAMTTKWFGAEEIDDVPPLLFFDADNDNIGAYAVLQTSLKLKKPASAVTWDDLREHGKLVSVDTSDVDTPTMYFKEPDAQHPGFHFKDKLRNSSEDVFELGKDYALDEIDDVPIERLTHIEPTDFFTNEAVNPNVIVDGQDLVDLLKKHSKNPYFDSLREKDAAIARRLKASGE